MAGSSGAGSSRPCAHPPVTSPPPRAAHSRSAAHAMEPSDRAGRGRDFPRGLTAVTEIGLARISGTAVPACSRRSVLILPTSGPPAPHRLLGSPPRRAGCASLPAFGAEAPGPAPTASRDREAPGSAGCRPPRHAAGEQPARPTEHQQLEGFGGRPRSRPASGWRRRWVSTTSTCRAVSATPRCRLRPRRRTAPPWRRAAAASSPRAALPPAGGAAEQRVGERRPRPPRP
jgi:hypothetical protein